jgi:hypothetical protein
MRRHRDKRAAEAFEAALAAADESHPELGPLVRLSGVLQPGTPVNQTRRAHTKDLMLRSFDVAQGRVAPAAGPVPVETPPVEPAPVNTATVVLAEGGVIYMADVEAISEARAAETAQVVLARARAAREA